MHERLKAAREAAGYKSATAAAEAFGWTYVTYKQHENGTRNFPRSKAVQYARAFRVSLSWLLLGEGPPPGGVATGRPRIEYVEVVGAVQAGAWREALEWPAADRFTIPTLASARWPGLPRFALQVRGDSMNQTFKDGWIVFCVSIAAKVSPRDGDYVVVQSRDQAGEVEATLKRLAIRGGVAWLVPESDNPEYAPIRLGQIAGRAGPGSQTPAPPLTGTAEAGPVRDGVDVEIIAIVDQFLGAP